MIVYKVLYKVYDGQLNEIENNYFYVEEYDDIIDEVSELLAAYNLSDQLCADDFQERCIISTGNQFINIVIMVERVDLMSSDELIELYHSTVI